MVRIAIDAMGGDEAPRKIIEGALASLGRSLNTKLMLFGPEEEIGDILSKFTYNKERVEVIDAPEIISLHESPVQAIRRKKNSGIVMGMRYVKEDKADAFISAGSSGAILAGGQLIIGRVQGVHRPPLAALIPTKGGVCLLLDSGANVDAKAEWLLQFARMGTSYVADMLSIPNPTVGLVNIGAEEEKGNALVKEAMPLLREDPKLNFIGSVEARDIVEGNCDVVVCDAFVGNVVLKTYEGTGKMMMGEITSALKNSGLGTLLGAALVQNALKKKLKRFDARQYGGAPVLGLKRLVVKVHGNTDGREITHAIKQCVDFVERDTVNKIENALKASITE